MFLGIQIGPTSATKRCVIKIEDFIKVICLTTIFLIPLPNNVPFGPIDIPSTEALLVLGLIMSLAMPQRYWLRVLKGSLLLWAVPFLLVVFVSSLVARAPDVTLRGALYLTEGLIFAILVSGSIRHKKDADSYLLVVALTGLLQAVIAIIQHFRPDSFGLLSQLFPSRYEAVHFVSLGTGGILRAQGTFPHPNSLGAYLSAALLFWIYFTSVVGTAKMRYMCLFCSLVVCIGLFFTYSRGAMLASLVGIISFFYIEYRQRNPYFKFKIKTVLIFTGLVLLLAVCIVLLSYSESAKIETYSLSLYSGFAHREEAVEDRYFRWRAALDIWSEYPIYGVGFNNFSDEYSLLHPTAWGVEQRLSAHNLVLELLATTGIIGFLAFAILCGAILARLARFIFTVDNDHHRCIVTAIFCFFIVFLVHHTAACYLADKKLMLIWWLSMGIGEALTRLKLVKSCASVSKIPECVGKNS